MPIRVEVEPRLLEWARERRGWSVADATARFPRFERWVSADAGVRAKPTMKQLERFAKATHTPIGFLFLGEPPQEAVPIPDCRTVRDREVTRPSPDMLETIYLCQQRQAWYREYALRHGHAPLDFVGSARATDDAAEVAGVIRDRLGFGLAERRACKSWEHALRSFIAKIESAGVMVMVNGIVGSNTHRRLDPEEFRGFALVDELAPVVFVNGKDAKAAQMFTLAHELAHVWLGQSALSDVAVDPGAEQRTERWCNAVAAELLVPAGALRERYDASRGAADQAHDLARAFKVSALVLIRRLYEASLVSKDEMWSLYRRETARLEALAARRGDGGDYYRTQPARLSRRFAEAVYVSAWEGQASFTEAMRLLSVSKMKTMRKLGASLGFELAAGD